MTVGKFALLLVALPLMAACSDKPPQSGASANPANAASVSNTPNQAGPARPASTAPVNKDGSHMDANSQNAAIAPPKPNEVLEAIYQTEAHGQDSMAVANGSEATYWYGHSFDLNGKHYYAGFVYATPEKYTQEQKDALPAPDAKVTLADATFQWIADGAKPGWDLVESEHYAGEFGSYEKADEVDEKEAVHSAPTANGGLLLAIPTWYLASGVRIKSFSMLVYNPSPADSQEESAWTFVGNIPRGEDNDAACDAKGTGNHIACVVGSAQIAFGNSPSAGLPDLHVTRTGSGFDEAGNKKTFGAGDVVAYRFNPKDKVYEAVK
jgi:hypothetical protein